MQTARDGIMERAEFKAKLLWDSVKAEDIDATRWVLENEANPNYVLPEGATPFHLAVGLDNENAIDFVKLMLQHGADPNVRSCEGMTPLHVSASWGKEEVMGLLLSNGADPYIKDEDNADAMDLAKENGDRLCIAQLQQHQQLLALPELEEAKPSYTLKLRRSEPITRFFPSLSPREYASSQPCSLGDSSSNQIACHLYVAPDQRIITEKLTSSESLPVSHTKQSNASLHYHNTVSPKCKVSSTSPNGMSRVRSTETDLQFALDGWDPTHQYIDVTSPDHVEIGYKNGSQALSELVDRTASFHTACENLSVSSLLANLTITDRDDKESREDFSGRKTRVFVNRSNSGEDSTLKWTDTPSRTDGYQFSTRNRTFANKDVTRNSLHGNKSKFWQLAKKDDADSAGKNTAIDEQQSVLTEDVYPENFTRDLSDLSTISRNTDGRFGDSGSTSGMLSRVCSGNLDCSAVTEYLYTDVEEGVTLLERRCPGKCANACHCSMTPSYNASLVSQGDTLQELKCHLANISASSSVLVPDSTVIYDWKAYSTIDVEGEEKSENSLAVSSNGSDTSRCSIPSSIEAMSNSRLRNELRCKDDQPGPVTDATCSVYLRRLARLMKHPGLPQRGDTDEYCKELNLVIQGKLDQIKMAAEEKAMCHAFDTPDPMRKWREGNLKSSFNYLLLDPRVTDNLPVRSQALDEEESFRTFLAAIFYIGKGQRSRPYSHFYEALGKAKKVKDNAKVKHIVDIWNEGLGVVSLHCFQNVIPVEAYTREACMIDALGKNRLTNQKRGDYYGASSTWSISQKRDMGAYLLFRAMKIFLSEGERQICPADIQK